MCSHGLNTTLRHAQFQQSLLLSACAKVCLSDSMLMDNLSSLSCQRVGCRLDQVFLILSGAWVHKMIPGDVYIVSNSAYVCVSTVCYHPNDKPHVRLKQGDVLLTIRVQRQHPFLGSLYLLTKDSEIVCIASDHMKSLGLVRVNVERKR